VTKSEYQELVEFLGGKFQRIDARFERIDARFQRIDARFERIDARFDATDEAIRHNGVLIDRNTDAIRKVAEGVVMLDEKLERFRVEFEARLP
jgi:hypothetical protein